MAGSRYSQEVDLQNWNSSHSLAILSVPPGSRVLDLGTADGSVARALKDRGCTVWGIECDEQAAEAALRVCDRVIVADLESREAFDPLADETFDVVLALDVLEHLRDPTPVLRRAATHLTPKGIAVVSIPNVTHGALRLSLLEGRFNYTEQGLLDRTHLRFFDRASAERLMSDAGLTITQNLRVRRELDETEIAVHTEGLSPQLLDTLARDPDAATYQFVFVAGRKDGLPASTPGGMLPERLIAENESLLAQFRETEKYVRSLEADRAARIEAAARDLTDRQRATAENEALLAQFKELEQYAKNLEADRAARIDGAAHELKQHQDELARAQSMHAQAAAESLQLRLERDELGQELTRRTQEAHQMQLELRHRKADVVVKDAYIADLRQQLDPLVAQRDQLLAQRDQLLAERAPLLAERRQLLSKRKQLIARREQLLAERGQLLARQESLTATVRELRAYTNSAGFRIVEGVIRRLRSFPLVFRTARAMARKMARRDGVAG